MCPVSARVSPIFVGRAKYDAWAKLEGTSKKEAMQSYIDLVKRLKG